MAVSRALRRLLHIRGLEEEQSRLALESALGEMNRIKHALAETGERDRRGRKLVESSVRTGQLLDRLAGLEEGRAASHQAAALRPRIEAMEEQVTEERQAFLGKRVERRQAETLLRETEARDAAEAGRRGQQALDEWYRSRLHRNEPETSEAASAEIGTTGPRS
jgi:flagellar biosynthesis chaperone FliJ